MAAHANRSTMLDLLSCAVAAHDERRALGIIAVALLAAPTCVAGVMERSVAMQRCARLRSAVALDDALAGLETAGADNPSITLSQTSIDARYTKDFDERKGHGGSAYKRFRGAQYVVFAMWRSRTYQPEASTLDLSRPGEAAGPQVMSDAGDQNRRTRLRRSPYNNGRKVLDANRREAARTDEDLFAQLPQTIARDFCHVRRLLAILSPA